MIIKVCGLKDASNLSEVDALGVGMLGRIFHKRSSRDITDQSPVKSSTPQAGVFVDASTDFIISAAKANSFTHIQLHGHEPVDQLDELKRANYKVIKAISVGSTFPKEEVRKYQQHCDFLLFDTLGKNAGGNGFTFDWDLLKGYDGTTPFILSGGIAPELAEAIKEFKHPAFAGIDLNSRFETRPGHKDVALLKTFLNELHTD